ncbi:MAG: two-component sensor histidine kinase [Achromobacter sp.]|uniref:histidine kinase n=1 Tax=Achromobacter pulmonis TaxID=1389932 RepID=A0A6S7CG20_9BURK|nr:ATP-binding protein [Achromobacter pulmonis]MCF7768471.1 two-component sensor histidine kinase [Achromobacter pulmonis]MPT25960.1 two-component sensor histidine kinase [Achromobacter sp.]CAB3633568.1 Adaptive-response sensory-kinase SasA [Achromobacter pulmonis]CAB3845617.1 Adaptive-response sensory-kinase SasA [Achromobacter pulmonis]
MDGLKRRLNESVQLKLSFTLSLSILLAALVAGVFSFASALNEAHELQDDLLRQIAHLMDRQHLVASPANAALDESNEDARVTVQRLGDSPPSTPVAAGAGTLPIPANLADGLHTLELDGESFRVMIKTFASGERFAVSQEADFRNEIARDGALRTVMPFLILVPVLLLIVGDLIRKMFRPIATLSKEVDLREEQALHPVQDHHLPVEVRPFAVAINRLLARVDQAMTSQRRFLADAAHELRSPLTALSLQAERLAQAEMSEVARERLAVLRQGIERGRSLVDQLLALAKAQSRTMPAPVPVSAQHVFRRVLEDLMPLAEAKHIDIGVEGAKDVEIWTSELDLTLLIRNLVDNAIRYTPERGRVDLSIRASGGFAELRIEDNGPGISLAERERVFDAFYRTLGNTHQGSGLGLSIVQTIANRIGAKIQLDFSDREKQSGLSVAIFIPIDASRR